MNEKKLYRLTITDENGEIMHDVKSDCIIAAISDVDQGSYTIGKIFAVSCTAETILCALLALEDIKNEVAEDHPEIACMLAIKSMLNKGGEKK